jgi:glutathione synthase/RimK-type ligase-like ATP-grasp enzyme
MTVIVRRRKLGRTSCREIAAQAVSDIKVWRSDRACPPSDDGELFIRWGCTVDVPSRNVLNIAGALHQVNDKLNFRETLDNAELCPPTYFSEREARKNATFPIVIRPRNHSRGRNFYICDDVEQLSDTWWTLSVKHGESDLYASDLIDKAAEYRVFVVSGRAVSVAEKTPGNPDDVAWNVAKGGRFDNVRFDAWPLKVVRYAIEAFNLTSLDFGGVDVMVGKDGEVYVIEINSAPSLTSPYRQSTMAKAFDYIVENGKDRIPLVEERGGYLKFIHPAISGKARMI